MTTVKYLTRVAAIILSVAAMAKSSAHAETPPNELPDPYVSAGVPHPGSDQIFWVPTFAQAQLVARHTGRLMLVMGSVSDWNGY